MGRRLYGFVKSPALSGDLIYPTPAENYGGRNRARCADEIQNAWVDSSNVVSRANAKGGNLRVAHGGKAQVAKSIASAFKCCPTFTALLHCFQVTAWRAVPTGTALLRLLVAASILAFACFARASGKSGLI